MTDLRKSRRRMLFAAAVLLIIDALAAAFLMSPWGRSRAALQQDYAEVRARLHARRDEAQVLTRIDAKIEDAHQQIGMFLDQRVATRYSEVVAELGRVASQHDVELTGVKYTVEETGIAVLRRMDIDATLEGDYSREVRFINALERSRMFFIVESVTLDEEQTGNVRLAIQLETYLHEGASAPAASRPAGKERS